MPRLSPRGFRLSRRPTQLAIELSHRRFIVRVNRWELADSHTGRLGRSAQHPANEAENAPAHEREESNLEGQNGDPNQRAKDAERRRQHNDRNRNRDGESEHHLHECPKQSHWYSSCGAYVAESHSVLRRRLADDS